MFGESKWLFVFVVCIELKYYTAFVFLVARQHVKSQASRRTDGDAVPATKPASAVVDSRNDMFEPRDCEYTSTADDDIQTAASPSAAVSSDDMIGPRDCEYTLTADDNMQTAASPSAAVNSDDMLGPTDCDSESSTNGDLQRNVSHSVVRVETRDVKMSKHSSVTRSREKKQCPLCGLSVTHLPRHLRSRAHNWKRDEAKSAIARFQLRKNYKYKISHNRCRNSVGILTKKASEASTGRRKPRRCPFSHCLAVVQRLPVHLEKIHGIPKGSDILQKYLNRAKYQRQKSVSGDTYSDDGDEADELAASHYQREQHILSGGSCAEDAGHEQEDLNLIEPDQLVSQ